MTAEALLSRWPTGARKVELIHGVIIFTGRFDGQDLVRAGHNCDDRPVEGAPAKVSRRQQATSYRLPAAEGGSHGQCACTDFGQTSSLTFNGV
ncbi:MULTISPECIES: hypothetical protein [unclassified Streptomyces]|uniref:hypothetical protein n=1 Tax=unclassified Streptomyces TaxID=2593676 RepID=UPI00381E358C